MEQGKKFPRKWENIGEFSRLMVPGGWLVSIEASADGGDAGVSISMAMCFVPDENNLNWELEEEVEGKRKGIVE